MIKDIDSLLKPWPFQDGDNQSGDEQDEAVQTMPQSGESFTKWSRDIQKQSERCDWTGYGVELAALDAIVIQRDNSKSLPKR